ncbi:MAG: hypothetical protein ABI035_14770 [Gemmatimonadaceae bacterium]
MAINGIGGGGFNPYAAGVTRPNATATRPTTSQTLPQSSNGVTASDQKSVANAIKNDAAARNAQLSSPNAPDGVDQDLWGVLSKEERSFFMKAGSMGPLTYGRMSSSQTPTPAPMLRGGRLDIKV